MHMSRIFTLLPSLLCALCISSTPSHTTISVCVQHALTGEAIENATVFCAENHASAVTMSDGYTHVLRVPFRASADAQFGLCTLVILCDGFLPSVCSVVTFSEKLRSGITLSLYPDDASMTDIPSLVEALPQEALTRIVDEAKKHTARS